MKTRRKNTFKIVTATGLCIFSLASAFTATIAWFSTKKDVGSDGMDLRVEALGNNLSILTVHRCNLAASTSSNYVFYSEPSIIVSQNGTEGSLHMDNYSQLNETQPVLLLFTLNDNTSEADVTISAKSDNDDYVATITAENISQFPFSTMVKFKSASYSMASYPTDFPFDNVSIAGLSNVTSFVDIDSTVDPNTGSASYSYGGFSQNINLFTGSANSNVHYIAVVMDYYKEARMVLFNNNVGADQLALANNNEVTLYCDWTLVI